MQFVEIFAERGDFFFGEKHWQQLVRAFADLAPDATRGNIFVLLAERPFPRQRMKVVGIHQRAIDIKNKRLAHALMCVS